MLYMHFKYGGDLVQRSGFSWKCEEKKYQHFNFWKLPKPLVFIYTSDRNEIEFINVLKDALKRLAEETNPPVCRQWSKTANLVAD